MRIFENESSNIVFDDGKEVGKLPFKIGLSDFWIEYYGEDDSTPWLLWVDAAPAEEEHGRRQETFDWAEGDKTELPLVGLKIEVLQYLPHASPGNLEVTQAGGKKTIVPADVNQEVSLDNSKGSLRIVKVFSHLIVQADHEVVNVPHSNANPALKIEFDQPGKEKSHIYVYTGAHSAHGQQIEGVKLQYLPKKDPTSPLPAMEVLLSDGDKKLHGWLVGKDPNRGASLPLTPLLGAATKPADDDGHGHDPNSYLVMARRSTPIKDYKSSLVVADEGAVVAEKVIEVNDPLHYGGYHFYQNSYDSQHGQYTVLFVKSDTGLLTVYAGFSLLCAGVFWSSWVRPGWNYLMKR